VVHEGDQVKVKIVRLDPERKRIGLSIKQVTEDEAREPAAMMPSNGGRPGEQEAAITQMAAELSRAFSRAQESPERGTKH
jgi:ribosomal protein S1